MSSPYITLPGNDTTSKFRANLRRRRKNLETARGKVTFRRVDAADAALLRAFYEMERAGWKGKEGSAIAQGAATKQYYGELAEIAGRLGTLTIYELSSSDKPIAMQYGLDPVYFGFLFVMNITLGSITPPVGVLLFVASGIWRVNILEIIREVWPFIIVQYAVLFLCMLFPQLVLLLPKLVGY